MAIKHPHLAAFYRQIHARGLTTRAIADAIHSKHSYVQRVLCGIERKGNTWLRVKDLLRPDEIALLEQVPARDRPPQNPPPRRKTKGTGRWHKTAAPLAAANVSQSTLQAPDSISTDPTISAFTIWKHRQPAGAR